MRSEEFCECPECGQEFVTTGTWSGDNWNEPREWHPDDEEAVCMRCADGFVFKIEFEVVGFEDFSKLTKTKDWADFFDSFDEVFLKQVNITEVK